MHVYTHTSLEVRLLVKSHSGIAQRLFRHQRRKAAVTERMEKHVGSTPSLSISPNDPTHRRIPVRIDRNPVARPRNAKTAFVNGGALVITDRPGNELLLALLGQDR